MPVAEITRPIIRRFVDQVSRMPVATGLPKHLRTAPIGTLMDYAESHPKHPTVLPKTVELHKATLNGLLTFAMNEDIIASHPGKGIEVSADERDKTRQKHHAALEYEDVPDFMRRLRAVSSPVAACLEFTILTASRSENTQEAEWSEFDLDRRLWTIPSHKMKDEHGGKPHRVFLSQAAIDCLPVQAGRYVFKRTAIDMPLNSRAMIRLLRKLSPGITVHGMRATFKTYMSEETDHAREAIEIAMAHSVGDAVEQAYNRRDMLVKRKALMEDWAAWCKGKSN
jgi:integrase